MYSISSLVELGVDEFDKPPRRRHVLPYPVGAGEIGQRTMTHIYAAYTRQEVGKIACKKSTMYIHIRVKILVASLHHISVRLMLHQGKHAVGVAAYHLAVAPSYGRGKEGHDLYIGKRLKATGKLHRVVADKFRPLINAASRSRNSRMSSISNSIFLSILLCMYIYNKG